MGRAMYAVHKDGNKVANHGHNTCELDHVVEVGKHQPAPPKRVCHPHQHERSEMPNNQEAQVRCIHTHMHNHSLTYMVTHSHAHTSSHTSSLTHTRARTHTAESSDPTSALPCLSDRPWCAHVDGRPCGFERHKPRCTGEHGPGDEKMKNLHVARNHSSANEARQKQDTGKEKLNNRNNRNNRSNNNTFVGRVGESEPNVGAHDVRGKMAGWGGVYKGAGDGDDSD